MLTYKPCLVAALLFLTQPGAGGAPGSPPVGRKLLQHLDPSWNLNQKAEGKARSSHLEWVDFDGALPADTVSNWNNYTKTTEYVCSTEEDGCNTGAYVPGRGPFCFYAFWQSEHRVSKFKLLVNRGNLEALRWVDDSFGDVPENAVEGCPSVDIYVGRNQYGLGKVSKDQRAFFVVVDHKEVWFKWYQVLAVQTGPADVTISDVRYNTSEAVGRGEDVTLTKTTVTNEGCRGTREEVALEEAAVVMHDWELDQKVFSTTRSRAVVDVQAGVEKCSPLAGSSPCRG